MGILSLYLYFCAGVETGRQASLRWMCSQGRGGSSPLPRTMLIFNIIGWIVAVILFSTFILLCFWVFSSFRKKTRFTPVPNSILKEIEGVLIIKDNSILYNLGCGDGRVLFYLLKQNSKAEYIGVEDNLFLLSSAYLRNWWNKKRNKNVIKIIKGDFFKQDLSKATHIFTYLDPKSIDDLLPKLDQELKPGTRLISLNFQFTVKKPISEVDLIKRRYQPIRKIFVYEF